MPIPPFHLAIPVDDLTRARAFYGDLLGCGEGRSADRWIDFNFFGHQLVVHIGDVTPRRVHNPVDGHDVPVPHFGVVLPREQWDALAKSLAAAKVHFLIEPHIRFVGQVGEQATMFFHDPFGNAIELKSMADPDALFAR